ncbi:MAG: SPFH domain-containing protein [Planctomycetota bacterium]|jgi:hypothetical protein
MPVNWRVRGEETVAARLKYSRLPGGLRRHVEVGPGEGALVVRGGVAECAVSERGVEYERDISRRRVAEDTETGLRVEILGPLEWLTDTLLGWLVQREVPSVVFFTREPVRLTFYLSDRPVSELDRRVRPAPEATVTVAHGAELALRVAAADGKQIGARCFCVLAVDTRDATRLPELMAHRRTLERSDLAMMIADKVLVPVLVPEIASHRSDDLMSDRRPTAEIATRLSAELQKAVAGWGMTVVDLTVEWGSTDADLLAIRDDVHRIADRMLADVNRKLLTEVEKLKTRFSQLKADLSGLKPDFALLKEQREQLRAEGNRGVIRGPSLEERESQYGAIEKEAAAVEEEIVAIEEELGGLGRHDPRREADIIERLLAACRRGAASLKDGIRSVSQHNSGGDSGQAL